MRNALRILAVLAVLMGIGILVGCEWEASDSFNTSQGAGVTVNFTGVYTADSGEYLVGTNITRIVLNQVGNRIEVTDDNGVSYTGTIGSPNVQNGPDDNGVYSVGATMLQAQINFSSAGTASSPHDNIQFVGVVRAIAVSENQSTTTTLTIDEGELQQVTTRTFTIDQGNTRYIIQGNWVIGGQSVESFSGYAPAQTGTFTA